MYKSIYDKNWIPIKLDENLRFSDLMQSAGMSDFTKGFRKKRNALGKRENLVAKLKKLKVNRKKDYITFIFKTKPTKLPAGKVNPNTNFSLSKARVYTMEIRILKFFSWLKSATDLSETGEFTYTDLKEILKVADIQVFCTCPSFHWMGMNYHMSMFDASIHPTDIPPNHWDKYHNEDQFLCKHLGGLTNQFKFYLNPMAGLINKYFK